MDRTGIRRLFAAVRYDLTPGPIATPSARRLGDRRVRAQGLSPPQCRDVRAAAPGVTTHASRLLGGPPDSNPPIAGSFQPLRAPRPGCAAQIGANRAVASTASTCLTAGMFVDASCAFSSTETGRLSEVRCVSDGLPKSSGTRAATDQRTTRVSQLAALRRWRRLTGARACNGAAPPSFLHGQHAGVSAEPLPIPVRPTRRFRGRKPE